MIKLKVNGEPLTLTLDEDMPLLWMLREHLQLTGTRFGCGMGLCGACTVHIDGVATRSCITPLAALEGKAITTIEGLAGPGSPHPLQSAWIEHNVPQCGYCQSGQIMSAAALLASNPEPDEQAIDQAMSGNLCRCGSYPRIRRAITSAARARHEPVQAEVQQWEP